MTDSFLRNALPFICYASLQHDSDLKVLLSTIKIPLKGKKKGLHGERASGDQLRASVGLPLLLYGRLLRHSAACLDSPGEMYTYLCTHGS